MKNGKIVLLYIKSLNLINLKKTSEGNVLTHHDNVTSWKILDSDLDFDIRQ